MKKQFFLFFFIFCTCICMTSYSTDQEIMRCQKCTERRQKIASHFFNIVINAFIAASHKDSKEEYTNALTRALESLSCFIQLLVAKTKNKVINLELIIQALEELSSDKEFLELLEQELSTTF